MKVATDQVNFVDDPTVTRRTQPRMRGRLLNKNIHQTNKLDHIPGSGSGILSLNSMPQHVSKTRLTFPAFPAFSPFHGDREISERASGPLRRSMM